LVSFSATRDILIDAHPHIGTNKLPKIISRIRNYILDRGGEIRFNSCVIDFQITGKQITGVKILQGDHFKAKNVILATGHSASDIFEMLHHKKIEIELKPMAVGVRVEYEQSLIDHIQYGSKTQNKWLPPAPYRTVKQIDGRGVYSFCMCPDGVIAPCATKPEEIVTNAWIQGGETQTATAQRLVDFVEERISTDLPLTSYSPGITPVNLESVLPNKIFQTLRIGFKEFNKSMNGYLTNDAVVLAPETRTSSPVRISRDNDTLQHVRITGLYPCGEGAGYAGGSISAALDGRRCALKISIAQ